jgi:hypothetical protein
MSDSSLVPIEESAVTFQTLKAISQTEFVPKGLRGRTEAMLAAVLAGRELGLGPMASLRGIDMIEGSPHLSGETIMALVRRAGHRIRIVKMGPSGATVIGERLSAAGEVVESGEFSFLEEDARAAGLLGKNNWKAYGPTMFAWRAITMCGRFMFADLLGGGVKLTYTADELGGQGAPEVFNATVLPVGEELAVLVEDAEVAAVEQKSLTISKPRGRSVEVRDALAALKRMDDPLAVPELVVAEPDVVRDHAEHSEPMPEHKSDPKPSFAELTALLGTLPQWREGTADTLEANTRRVYVLMQGLGIWETKAGDNADPFHAGLARFGDIVRRDPEKWGVDAAALRGDPLQHFGSLGNKQNKQVFAALTVTWAENRLEKGKP